MTAPTAVVTLPPTVDAWRRAAASHARAPRPRHDRAAFTASLDALWAARLAMIDDPSVMSYLDTLAA
jgi:hypothetical protein